MLAASIPALQTTATMGISQQSDNLDLSPRAQGVYLALDVSSSTSRHSSDSQDNTSRSSSPDLAGSTPSGSPVSFSEEQQQQPGHVEDLGKDGKIRSDERDQSTRFEAHTELQAPSAKPKYGSTIVGLPDEFMRKVEGLGKEKEKRKKKKWRAVSAEDMGFKLSLFPREPGTCDEKEMENELKIFDAVVEAEVDNLDALVRPYRNLLEVEGTSVNKEKKFLRRDSDRRVQKAHRQVKSKDITSVLNNRGRKTLYVHFRIYKRNLFLHCSNLEHPNLPSPRKREGVCLDVAKSAIKADMRGRFGGGRIPGSGPFSSRPPHPAQNLHHALDNRNAGSELPIDLVSFLINIQHREMTPEDYEMLLRLDESVAPKTVANDVIAQFKTDVVDESTAGGVCSVCMEVYEVGQSRKFLPCEHVFHVQCIDMWLANSSQNCPLDGLPVGLS